MQVDKVLMVTNNLVTETAAVAMVEEAIISIISETIAMDEVNRIIVGAAAAEVEDKHCELKIFSFVC